MNGQNVVIQAIPYDPYSGSPIIGITKVYLNKKLLYTIDKYYREKIFTSNDGQYLVVVHDSYSIDIQSETSFGLEKIDFNRPAIEVFKNGQTFKTFTLKDVIDTSKLAFYDGSFYWGYYVDFEGFQKAEFGCESCKEVYGRRVLRTRDTSEIEIEDWDECKRKCDSARFKNTAVRISKNSIYVDGNSLYVLTNQNMLVKLDFSEMSIQKISLDKVIPNLRRFSPPTIKGKYHKIKYPVKFLLPELINGKTIGEGLAEFLNKRLATKDSDSATIQIYFHTLLINKEGKCELVYVSSIVRNDIKKDFMYFRNDVKLEKVIEDWIKQQTFKTTNIPRDFYKYKFSDFVFLM